VGNFVLPIPLNVGANRIELDIQSAQNGNSSFTKTISFDPALSTAGRRMLYVSSVNPDLSGTIVIDVDSNIFLGLIANKPVRGISPDGKQVYMDDLSVISTSTHQQLPPASSPLAFSQEIPSDGFLVSPDGQRLYSLDEALDVATNQILPNKLPASIETGYSFAGSTQGGPAVSPDGKRIFFGSLTYDYLFTQNGVVLGRIDTLANSVTATGILPSNAYLSDIAMTPDGRRVLVSSYGYAVGNGDIFDAKSYQKLATVGFGDFAGQVASSPDSTKAIFGRAGNPQLQGGGITVVDIASGTVTATATIDLADHLAISDRSELFVSSGDTPGINVFALQTDGTLLPSRQFVLAINQFMLTCCYGAPQNDDIEKIVFKP
jgi:DNA-binding beta-propeller fold protein YncE